VDEPEVPEPAVLAPLRERMRSALPAAMKARDAVAVAALRATLGAVDNAEAVQRPAGAQRGLAIERSPVGVGAAEAERRVLTEADVVGIVRDAIAEREDAARGYDEAGRPDRAQRLRDEAQVLSAFLS
jgi:uncharacterized protein